MAELLVTTALSTLHVLFNQMREVYYLKTANTKPASIAAIDIELPVLEDGVTFDTGAPDVSKIKLTTGATWTSVTSAGDSDISFQVPSVADAISSLFFEQKATSAALGGSIGGASYAGAGYTNAPKQVTGGLLMRSEDKNTCIFLPNVEMYASFVSEDDKPAYFNVVVTPLEDEDGCSMYFLTKSE